MYLNLDLNKCLKQINPNVHNAPMPEIPINLRRDGDPDPVGSVDLGPPDPDPLIFGPPDPDPTCNNEFIFILNKI